MIQKLKVIRFTRFMTSGRTSPALCGCEDEFGAPAGDYVVKLRGSLQERGLLNELIGAKLANHFGLSTPDPALVLIEAEMAELIADANASKASMVRDSAGQNFGTKELIGFSTWPVDKTIPDVMLNDAANIFAFDSLVQNPDRRHSNPNLLVNGDIIMAIDHELAFSFLLDVFPSKTPWKLDRSGYLTEHVFYRQLKDKQIDIEGFSADLSRLTDATLEGFVAEAPAQWDTDNGLRMRQHLVAIRENGEEFADELRRFLA